MTTMETKGNWDTAKRILKKHRGSSQKAILFFEGKRGEIIDKLEKRTGETCEAIEKTIWELLCTCNKCGCACDCHVMQAHPFK